jgi:hypothetical protein
MSKSKKQQSAPQTDSAKTNQPQNNQPQNNQPPPKPKSYEEVITAQAKTRHGLFAVHRVEQKTYYEIPLTLLNRDMLWYTEIAQTPVGIGYSG